MQIAWPRAGPPGSVNDYKLSSNSTLLPSPLQPEVAKIVIDSYLKPFPDLESYDKCFNDGSRSHFGNVC